MDTPMDTRLMLAELKASDAKALYFFCDDNLTAAKDACGAAKLHMNLTYKIFNKSTGGYGSQTTDTWLALRAWKHAEEELTQAEVHLSECQTARNNAEKELMKAEVELCNVHRSLGNIK